MLGAQYLFWKLTAKKMASLYLAKVTWIEIKEWQGIAWPKG